MRLASALAPILAPVLVGLLFVAGCGYHVVGTRSSLPPELRTLYIEMFENRTAEPYLDNRVVTAVTGAILERGLLEPREDRRRVDVLLSGSVTGYEMVPVAYDREDRIVEYRIRMTVRATLRRTEDGRILWRGESEWQEEFLSSPDLTILEDREAQTARLVSERIAENLVYRMAEGI